jgi:hypothetical protein
MAGVCEDHSSSTDSEAVDVCCMLRGRVKGYREREHLGSSRFASIFLLAYIVFSHQVLCVFIRVCIIPHDITIDDEYGGAYDVDDYEIVWSFVAALNITLNTQALPPSFTNRHPLREVTIYVSSVHNQLQNNLIEHI